MDLFKLGHFDRYRVGQQAVIVTKRHVYGYEGCVINRVVTPR